MSSTVEGMSVMEVGTYEVRSGPRAPNGLTRSRGVAKASTSARVTLAGVRIPPIGC